MIDLKTLWIQTLGEIEVEIGKNQYNLYFKNSVLLSLDNGIAKLGFTNKAVATQTNQRYYALIQTVLEKKSKNEKISLLFETIDKPLLPSISQPVDDLGPLFTSSKELSENLNDAIKKAHLRPDFTLEEFCVSTSNQLAFAAAQAVAKNPGKNYNPFFIWGGVGIGKTHLMQAIGHEILRKSPRARVIYASGEQFTNEIIQGIRKHDTADFKEKYRSVDALLIDDVQFLSGKDTAQEEFFHTFNAVHGREGQIVMTSDTKPAEIKDLTDRLRSRFEGGLVADIGTPDSELKTAICQLKARKRGVDLSTNIASIIAGNVDNIRSLDGALQQILSRAATEKKLITPEFVADTLKLPLVNSAVNRLDARTILDAVCAFYEITIKLIKGTKRDKPIVEPRQVLMYLLKKHTGMTLDEIADFLGGRDHTTIMHGSKKIEALLQTSDRLQKDIQTLQAHLGL